MRVNSATCCMRAAPLSRGNVFSRMRSRSMRRSAIAPDGCINLKPNICSFHACVEPVRPCSPAAPETTRQIAPLSCPVGSPSRGRGRFMSAKSPDAIDRLVGRNICIQRLAKGLSQTDLAAQLGVSFQQVQKYERGANRIGAGRLVRIAGTLDVSLLTLFEGIDGAHGPDGPSPQALLAQPLHLSLVQAFSRLDDREVRRALVSLVRHMAQHCPRKGGTVRA